MKIILFVEDESALQRAFGDVLRKEGFEVFSALDGETGYSLAKKIKPDLILLDLILPRMDGFEFLEKMREDPDIKDIPVIVLTNLESKNDIEKAVELGAKNYLVKANYTLSELVEKVKQVLAQAQ